MQEIILCRLGSYFAPYWIQAKYFESKQIKFVVMEKTIKEVSDDEFETFKKNKSFRGMDNKEYIHHKLVRNPNPFEENYAYATEREYEFIRKHEKEVYFLNDKKLLNKFDDKFLERIDMPYDDGTRTDEFLIGLVKEYQKAFPDGDGESWFGKWCWNVVSIPDDVEYEIDEPEGCNECIREVHRVWLFNGEQIGKEVRK